MLREIDLNEVSDGKLYTNNDMVKADCGDCKGCSSCCRGMGTSVILDPLDLHRLCTGLKKNFDELMESSIELNVVDGIILPNLRMNGTDEACHFLNNEGRCSIHPYRPGFCRLFPLGRFYENGSFQYFLQVHECPKPGKSKIKIRKWIDTPDIKRYETYICDWHYYLKGLQEQVMAPGGEELVKSLSMHVLRQFYLQPYEAGQDFYGQFYEQFYERLSMEPHHHLRK